MTTPYDGVIDNQLSGKTIDRVYKDGENLIFVTECGHWVYIKWLEGEPIHVKTDVRIVLPGVSIFGGAGAF